jgi:hypothetical protein
MKAEDEFLNQKMKEAGDFLNLKGHLTGLRDKKTIYGPGDIEVHKGKVMKFFHYLTFRMDGITFWILGDCFLLKTPKLEMIPTNDPFSIIYYGQRSLKRLLSHSTGSF